MSFTNSSFPKCGEILRRLPVTHRDAGKEQQGQGYAVCNGLTAAHTICTLNHIAIW